MASQEGRKEVAPSWLVRASDGSQFSVTHDEAEADRIAARIGGTREWYTPVQSTAYRSIGDNYDH